MDDNSLTLAIVTLPPKSADRYILTIKVPKEMGMSARFFRQTQEVGS